MKKLFIIACLSLIGFMANAQAVSTMKNTLYPTLTSDTVTNTGTGAVYINLLSAYSNVSIQPKVTRISGTMNSNSAPKLQGSLDGTNYYDIVGDTLHITNTGSPIVDDWLLTSQGYKYYKVTWTGTGTMSAKLEAIIYTVKP
jgi:hypothetical protein